MWPCHGPHRSTTNPACSKAALVWPGVQSDGAGSTPNSASRSSRWWPPTCWERKRPPGLTRAVAPLAAVDGGISHELFRLHATTGHYAAKRLYDDRLASLPGLRRLNSTLVMKQVISDRPLPA